MRYLLDTNALIYFLSAPDELSAKARRIVQKAPDLFVSIASLWEIGIKQSLGKLHLGLTPSEIEKYCVEHEISILPIRASAIDRLAALPDIHRDPFDRLLIAQAQDEDLVVVTHDRIIPNYPVETLW
jgi:PIN domain nuclease of toxin-antitoxin system